MAASQKWQDHHQWLYHHQINKKASAAATALSLPTNRQDWSSNNHGQIIILHYHSMSPISSAPLPSPNSFSISPSSLSNRLVVRHLNTVAVVATITHKHTYTHIHTDRQTETVIIIIRHLYTVVVGSSRR